jgi:hypothetical protein
MDWKVDNLAVARLEAWKYQSAVSTSIAEDCNGKRTVCMFTF